MFFIQDIWNSWIVWNHWHGSVNLRFLYSYLMSQKFSRKNEQFFRSWVLLFYQYYILLEGNWENVWIFWWFINSLTQFIALFLPFLSLLRSNFNLFLFNYPLPNYANKAYFCIRLTNSDDDLLIISMGDVFFNLGTITAFFNGNMYIWARESLVT